MPECRGRLMPRRPRDRCSADLSRSRWVRLPPPSPRRTDTSAGSPSIRVNAANGICTADERRRRAAVDDRHSRARTHEQRGCMFTRHRTVSVSHWRPSTRCAALSLSLSPLVRETPQHPCTLSVVRRYYSPVPFTARLLSPLHGPPFFGTPPTATPVRSGHTTTRETNRFPCSFLDELPRHTSLLASSRSCSAPLAPPLADYHADTLSSSDTLSALSPNLTPLWPSSSSSPSSRTRLAFRLTLVASRGSSSLAHLARRTPRLASVSRLLLVRRTDGPGTPDRPF